jgi:putative PIN family toxin of toxin-antitoxin system
MKTHLICVPDTNVLLAAERSSSAQSPCAEIFQRWINDDFMMLVSADILVEYIEKLHFFNIKEERVTEIISLFLQRAELVPISTYHLRYYPTDSDDIAFVLCAVNGAATHLVSYDVHLLDIAERTQQNYGFKTCEPLDFLRELRALLGV